MTRVTLATIWLDGCSGCHMSFLDMDDYLLDIADRVELIYSPLVDRKDFPEMVDVTLIEGAVSNEDDLNKIKKVRAHTKFLISLGDCAVTGNVPGMRNLFPVEQVIERAYFETADLNQQTPDVIIPPLLPKVRPVHQVVPVDLVIPGCPPPAKTIKFVIDKLLAGEVPDLSEIARFG